MSENGNPLARSMRGATRRFVVLGLAAGAIVAIVMVGNWAATPTFVPILHDLDLKEAGLIADQLGKGGVKHRLGAGGTAVEVPVADAARARVLLAKSGLPADGRPGLELFDKPTWGMTDFTQRVTFQRALEGELARTIGAIQGIESAQVHLVLPTPGALKKLEKPASASVVLALGAGQALSEDAVQGITYIVSNSVEGLSPDNVAVMDDGGRLLSVPSAGSPAGLTNRQLDIQRSVEQHLAGKIESMLTTVLGAGRSRAQVAALMSFDQVDRTVESFDPELQVLQTEQRSETDAAAAPEGGAQTIVSNEYQNSRSVERSTSAVGRLERLTVAVLVDTRALRGGAGVTPERIEGMVRDAIGADSTRGDRVSVLAVPFEAAAAAAPAPAPPAKVALDPVRVAGDVGRPLAGVAAIVAVLLIAWRALGSGAMPRASGGTPDTGGGDGGGGPLAARELPAPQNTEAQQLRNRLKAESLDRPETTAQVLRAWLAEN
jgi:flagellar M-ring protein FliF